MLKTVSLVDQPVVSGLWFETRAFLSLAIFLECLLAGWMLAGFAAPWLHRVGAASFAVFFLSAASKWMVGEESCGCFGSVAVPPLVTAAIDLVFLAAFLLVPAPGGGTASTSGDTEVAVGSASMGVSLLTAGGGGLVGIVLGVAALLGAPAVMPLDQAKALPETGLIVIDPADWLSKAFPLFPYVEGVGTADLKKGAWWVALYSHTCGHCLEMLPQLEAAAAGRRIAVVSVPPHAHAGNDVLPAGGALRAFQLSKSRDWFAATPLLLRLQDGVVAEAVDRDEADALIQGWEKTTSASSIEEAIFTPAANSLRASS